MTPRLFVDRAQWLTADYSYTSTNTITAGTYDANGCTTALGGNTCTWAGANRIVTVANSTSNTSSSFWLR
jgi:hypothetical protein